MNNHDIFFIIEGTLGLVSVLLLVVHLIQPKLVIRSKAQRMRYIALFGYAVATVYGSVEQVVEETYVESQHIVTFVAIVFFIITLIVSIRETRQNVAEY